MILICGPKWHLKCPTNFRPSPWILPKIVHLVWGAQSTNTVWMRLYNVIRGPPCVYACKMTTSARQRSFVHVTCKTTTSARQRSCSPCRNSVDYGNKITQHAVSKSVSLHNDEHRLYRYGKIPLPGLVVTASLTKGAYSWFGTVSSNRLIVIRYSITSLLYYF